MTPLRLTLILASAMTLPAPAVAQDPARSLFPDLPSAAVSISWEDLKGLLLKVQPQEKPQERPEPAPVPWALAKTAYAAKAGEDLSVRIDAVFDIVVWKERGWVRIPIVGGAIAPVGIVLDGEPSSLVVDKKGWYTLLLNEPGPHRLELSFFIQAHADQGVVSFDFPCQRSAQTHMTLEVPVPEARVSSEVAAHIDTRRTEDALIAELELRTSDKVAVGWTLPTVAVQPVEAEPPAPPRIASFTTTLALLTDRYVSCDSWIRYRVLRGETDTFRLRLPVGANVMTVTGQGAEWVHSEEGDYQFIDVKVNHLIQDDYVVKLRYEAPFEGEQATLAIPELATEDVVRTTGFIGIAAVGNVEVGEAPELEGLTRVDISELPAELRTRSPNPFLFAFKYVEDAYLLALDVRKLEDVAVRVASIDRATLTTVITEDGMAITRARYEVRNNEKQFLRIEVGEGTEIWGAQVGGRPVKPARDEDAASILIPLFKSTLSHNRLGAFPVELVYKTEVERGSGLMGSFGVHAPATDILVNEVLWEIWTPDSRRVYRTGGDLDAVEEGLAARGLYSPHTTGVEQETLYRLREGIERFMITDINNPGASSIGGENTRYRGDPLGDSGASGGNGPADAQRLRRDPTDLFVAGVLPVRITLPTTGRAHRFQGFLIPKGRAIEVTLSTYPASAEKVVKAVLLALSVLAGFALHQRALRRRALTDRALIGLAASSGFLVVMALMVSTFAGVLAAGLVAGMGGPALIKRLASGPAPSPESEPARAES